MTQSQRPVTGLRGADTTRPKRGAGGTARGLELSDDQYPGDAMTLGAFKQTLVEILNSRP